MKLDFKTTGHLENARACTPQNKNAQLGACLSKQSGEIMGGFQWGEQGQIQDFEKKGGGHQ